MKITYLPYNHTSRIGVTVPTHDLENGEIGKCYGWDGKRVLLWYVDGPYVYKKKYNADGSVDEDWMEQTVHLNRKRAFFNRKVEIIE